MGQVISIGTGGVPYVRRHGVKPLRESTSCGAQSDGDRVQLSEERRDWNTADRELVREIAGRRRECHREHLRAARNAHYRAELEKLGLL